MLPLEMATESPRRAETRRRLIEAAMDVVSERGYHRAAVDDVARAAGYSIGALYSNFGGKDDLLFAVFDEHVTWAARALTDAPAAGGTAEWVATFEDCPRQF